MKGEKLTWNEEGRGEGGLREELLYTYMYKHFKHFKYYIF